MKMKFPTLKLLKLKEPLKAKIFKFYNKNKNKEIIQETLLKISTLFARKIKKTLIF